MNTLFTEDEEKERVIKVVEYLEPLMSTELLCKFPDNTSFDFDYSQSIWSPLLPRRYNSMDFDSVTPIKLYFESEEMIWKNSLKKVTSTIKKSFRFSSLKSSSNLRRKKMDKTMVSDFYLKPVNNKIKGWSKLLKATTKHFNKKGRERERE